MTFVALKLLHVLAAIVAVGANATYGVWIGRAGRDRATLAFALRGVQWLDDRVANPAYVVLLASGVLLALLSGLALTTPWVLGALTLYALLAAIGLLGYTPTLRRQIAALERTGADSPQYRALARRGNILGAALGVVVLALLALMIAKPALWS